MGRLLASPRWGARPETLGRSGLSLGPDALAVIDQADRKRKSFKRYLDDTKTYQEVERKKTIIHIHKNNRYICNKNFKTTHRNNNKESCVTLRIIAEQ